LRDRLHERIALPEALQARDALRGHLLATLPLVGDCVNRYGAPYATAHRADLQAILLEAVQQGGSTELRLNTTLTRWVEQRNGVNLEFDSGATSSPGPAQVEEHAHSQAQVQASALVGADGLWSRVRASGWTLPEPSATGHLAYRAMLPQSLLPERLRSQVVTVWMGPHLHLVTYPVRQGEWLNVVVLVEGRLPAQSGWDVPLDPGQISADVQSALRGMCRDLHDVLRPVETWRAWSLWARPDVRGPQQMAHGRVALLGDAAHPMLPYLAQGAGMAIEDAWQLAQSVQTQGPEDVAGALADYARARWARNAQVQRQARRNGRIFHLSGPMAWARNAALRWDGPRWMDQPWLYGGK